MTLGNSSSFEVQAPCDQAAARPVVRRVFHLIDSFNVGGTETQAVELARRLPATGYEVTVGCLKREGTLEDRLQGTGIAIREFRSRGGIDSPSGLRQLLRMSWFLRSFDIVHTHDLWSNLVGVPAARLDCFQPSRPVSFGVVSGQAARLPEMDSEFRRCRRDECCSNP